MKKVIVQFSFPGLTSKQFDQAWDEIRKAGHSHPKGLIHHFAGQQGSNWVVVDVWQSAEEFGKFGEILIPILSKLGIANITPVVTPVYFEYSGVTADATT